MDLVISKICGLSHHLTSQLQISSCGATLRTEYTRIDLGHLLNSVRQLRMKSETITGRHFGKHHRIGCEDYSCALMEEDDIFNICSEESPKGTL